MDLFITLTITGLCTAGIYAIAASGLVLTYTTTGVFNFAHGAIGMLGAFMYWQLHVGWGWAPFPAALLVLVVLAPAFGALLDITIMRRLEGTSEVTQLVVTISLLVGLVGLGQWIWSPEESHTVERFWQGNTLTIGPAHITWHAAFAFVLAIVVAFALRGLLFGTRAGVTMRAGVDDRPLALLNGARANRSSMLAWAIGCSLAALAGILISPDLGLSHTTLTLLIVNAYAAAVIGRLRSLPFTFLGAVILGLADAYATGYVSTRNHYLTGFRSAIPVLVLFVALLVMPQARLRGHSAVRARERLPLPSVRGTVIGCATVLVVTAALAPLVSDGDALSLSRMFAFGIIAVSLVPLVGYAGQISLCQMSFAGIGAVVMAHLGGGGSPAGLLWAALITGAVGAVVALPALRLSGIYLALATGAFAVVLDKWLFKLPNFTVGPMDVKLFEFGTVPVHRLHVPFVDPSSEKAGLVVLATAFCLAAAVVVAVRRSSFGERLIAMKDSPAACATLGMNLTRTKLAVFVLSASMAGVGGALYAGTIGSVAPDFFNFFQSLPILLLAVVGGIGTVGGALFAGMVLFGIPLATASLAWFVNVGRVLPGAMGVGLGQNPNGVVPDVTERFAPIARSRPVLLTLVAALVALTVAAHAGLLDNWPYAFAVAGVIIGAAAVADRVRLIGEPEETWEWVGVDRPFTDDDVAYLDHALGHESTRS